MTDSIFLFDTETIGLPPRNFIYDFGWIITDRYGNIKKERNFLIEEVITDGKKMMGAFYARKIFNHYIPALDHNDIKLTPLCDVMRVMYSDLEECTTIAAYNIGFDLSALTNTVDILQHQEPLMLDGLKILCLWNFACNVLLSNKKYQTTARANGWRSKAGNYKTTAEHTYRYITGENNFIEKHTALDDCMIENQIMAASFAKKQTIPYGEFNNAPWRKAQPQEQLDAMRMVRRMKQLEFFN